MGFYIIYLFISQKNGHASVRLFVKLKTGGFVMGIIYVIVQAMGVTKLSIMISMWSWLLSVLGMWKIFSKAGERPWKALIPFYNEYTETKLAWSGRVYFIILALSLGMVLASVFMDRTSGISGTIWLIFYGICIAGGLIYNIKKCSRLSKCFGKGNLFALGLIVIPPLFRLLLGYGDEQYRRELS